MRRLALLSLVALACHDHKGGHDHSDSHPEGHDHHAEGHGHGDQPTVSFTLWSPGLEIFAEHPPAVAGAEVSMLVHVTALEGFAAVESGAVTVELSGPAAVRGRSDKPIRPGIYRVSVTPPKPGRYRGALRVDGFSAPVDGLELQVFETAEAAATAVDDGDDGALIEFLKEQQWRVPFATVFAETGAVVASVEVAGRIATPPGGVAEVGAPVTGRVIAPRGGLPRPGAAVTKGQVLAMLAPAPSSPEAAARAALAVAEADARQSAARAALERAERLIRDEAISARELEDARRESVVAAESVRAARRAAALYSGASAGGRGSWRLAAPIAGTLDAVDAKPGATVSPGDILFRIVDPSELWIVARVPEQDAARLRTDRDASFQIAGLDSWQTIDITGDGAPASIVSVGRTVDPTSRTVDVIYSVGAGADPSMRVGGLVQLAVPTGDEHTGVVVPRGAVINRDGTDRVYVQVDGEHFEERQVRIGPRAGGRVGVVAGLKAGERVVTQGAHLLRLADRAGDGPAHGHIH